MSSQPSFRNQRGVYRRLGNLQCKLLWNFVSALPKADRHLARFPLPLHFTLVEDASSLPSRQQRLGIPKVRSLNFYRLDIHGGI
jgi:hypothetical protein